MCAKTLHSCTYKGGPDGPPKDRTMIHTYTIALNPVANGRGFDPQQVAPILAAIKPGKDGPVRLLKFEIKDSCVKEGRNCMKLRLEGEKAHMDKAVKAAIKVAHKFAPKVAAKVAAKDPDLVEFKAWKARKAKAAKAKAAKAAKADKAA